MPAKVYTDNDADLSALQNKTLAVLGFGAAWEIDESDLVAMFSLVGRRAARPQFHYESGAAKVADGYIDSSKSSTPMYGRLRYRPA